MATSAHAMAVKSLNSSGGRKRFSFKTFSDRIGEIDIVTNVFRSLDKVKAEPSEGSSFFKDSLVEWRELNTAEDFISFYEEIFPFVQTLPLVLLHKELIFSELESRLQLKSRLSLEPILRLIAVLSRDLLDDFLPFLPRIVKSLVSLLESGGEKEPEIVEQIFTSWSYIMMYLQKYLICNIEGLLRDTLELRYYPKEYIKEFMSESISFLLRNAGDEQHEKGIRRILSEVANPLRKSGGVALLYYVMRGTSTNLHSKVGRALRFLLKDSTFSFCDKFDKGSRTAVEVVSSTLQRLCEDFEASELNIMWKCLYSEINESAEIKNFIHLSRLLAVLTSVVRINKGRKTSDNQAMKLVSCLMPTIIEASKRMVENDNLSDLIDEVLQLMLGIIDSLQLPSEVDNVAMQWSPVFAFKSSSVLTFIRELLQKDHLIVKAFTTNILSAINNMVESSKSSEEIVYLLLLLAERQEATPYITEIDEKICGKIHEFLENNMKQAVQDIVQENIMSTQIDEGKLATFWGVINSYHYFKVDSSLLVNLVHALREHLPISGGTITSAHEMKWQSLFGAALSSYYKSRKINCVDVSEALSFAKNYNSCVQVLSAVADYLDGLVVANGNQSKEYHVELRAEKAVEAFKILSENLRNSNKDIRVMTLRILCHFEGLSSEPAFDEQPPKKKMKTEETQASLPKSSVLQSLLSIEETPLTITTSRKLVNLIATIQMDLSAGRIHEAYVPLVFNGMMGVFHNRFSYLWDQTSECLAVLLKKHTGVIWDELVCYFGQCQVKFGTRVILNENENHSMLDKSTDLVVHFSSFLYRPSDSTPSATVVSLLLRTLQKVPFVAESRSSDIIPLFLEFLGYNREDLVSVGLFNRGACKGKEWKGALKEWLSLLKLMRNPRAFHPNQFVKDVLQYRLLDDNDAEIQMNALECLSLWKDDFVLPYYQNLKNLISSKDLREELTTWSLSKQSNCVEEAHRVHLVSLVIRILMPKVRKLKTLASRKHTSVHHRKAVLCFIAQLDVCELTIFFALLIKPLNITSEGTMDLFWTSPDSYLDHFQMSKYLKYFSVESISSLSWKKKFGFLHVIQHTLEVFDEFHIRPFLDFLMGCVVRLLVNSTARNATDVLPTSDEKENSTLYYDQTGCRSSKQFKELRSLCLKIIALVLDKHEDCDLGSEFWDIFFAAVNPLIKSFKQEGSSSEKPSSLFSCFLSMSRSHNLVTLLCRENSLVPDIFSILTVATASEAVKSSVLKFVENLLSLDRELGDEDNMVKTILVPNAGTLIHSLHSLFLGDTSKRNSVRYHGEREITILELLSKYILDQSHAEKYLDVLLSFLAKSVKDSEIRRRALQTVQYIIPALGTESMSKILNIISPLLIDSDLDARLCICELLKALVEIDSSLDIVANLICDLNATSAMEVDGLDYDKIANTYAEIDVDFFQRSSEQHTLILLSQSVYNMSSKEHTLRDGAYGLLRTFVAFSASVLRQKASDSPDISKEVEKPNGNWTKAHVLRTIKKFLLKHMGRSMIRGGSIRKEWIHLIREMVIELPDAGNLASFKALCSENPEVDFFKNIVHLQKHRIAKALMRFANVISTNSLHEGVVTKLFVPLFFNMLLEGQDGKDDNVRTACVAVLASISAHMRWESYYALLSRSFREMSKHSDKTKILLRLICSILDKFHFAEGGNSHEAEECSFDSLNDETCLEISTRLQKTVFPKIQKLMNSDSDKVNVNINLAAVKVLKLLPKDIMNAQLPAILHRICSFLKNRLESTRDEARLALAACLKELGLEYLQSVIKILRAILKRGFELHVLGYTVNFILSKCLSNPLCGKLDDCLEDLLAVVETDIFGDVAEQKEVEKIASKMKETRKCKSYETLKLIAQNVTFKSHVRKLLSLVTGQLQRHLTPKLKSKLENMLDHIAAGIEGNPSVVEIELFPFVYENLVDDSINREKGTVDQFFSPASKKERKDLQKKAGSAGFVSGTKSCSQLITVFALGLLHNRVKNTNPNECTQEFLEMLVPFVEKLTGCLSSKYEDVVSSTLRCFTALVRFLPYLMSCSIEGDKVKIKLSTIDKVKIALLTIAQSAVDCSSPLVQSCLKLLTVLLRTELITLSSEQLRMLFQFPMFVDLETDPSFVALSLLKVIVKREHVVPEIYDIAIRVGELMVKSQLESIRKKCSQILLQFLVRYKFSENRLQQHVDFLLANLRYEHPSGREAVLEMLHAVIKKLSEPRLKKQSMALFVHLVGCLANDGDSNVRSQTGTVIKFLIGHITEDQVSPILSCCLSWYSSNKQQLQAAAAQVLGFFIEVKKKSFQEHINTVLQKAETILKSAVSSASQQTQDTVDVSSIPFWKEAYYSLVMIEKMLHQFPGLCFGDDTKDIWSMVFELLQHPHAWLRNISCRFLNFYFNALAKTKRSSSRELAVDSLLTSPTRLFKVAVSLCIQLKEQPTTGDTSNVDILTANIVFAVSSLHSLTGQADTNRLETLSALEEDERNLFLEAFELLGSRKERSNFLALTSGEQAGESEDGGNIPRKVFVGSLLKKMGKLALEMELIQTKTVFNVYKSFTSQMNQEECCLYASIILLPLYKICEGFAGKVISDELKQQAEELKDSLRDTLGMKIFEERYREIRERLKKKRENRKREEKVMAVVNPVRNAKRKLRLAAKNRENKRRRTMSFKMARFVR
ncbi:PREDICTED: small subunit processome component 20 homolog isoform X2 [Tarenaya hassleriana]|uniref:small subunit processome component 20 homolog isoform X1 n=1 Tax=Tarenaya hassleriana TaxID=28532 RepID=UPI00053C1664|nr:PREDICTED: small subunit processome component 20 homolog isoform X1 [Tarenaya hassleriana]XP_010532761.1 PREDICTED: small subunit processome component 20 homolog isoform X2 [Tarenaya hassleriana]